MKKIIIACLAVLVLDSCRPGEKRAALEADSVKETDLSPAAEIAVSEHENYKGEKDEKEIENSRRIQPGQLTAGEWNDLSHWSFWDSLQTKTDFSKFAGYWSYDLSHRVSVQLKNSRQEAAKDVTVELLDDHDNLVWSTRSDSKGRAELWPLLKHGKQSSLQGLKLRAGTKVLKDPKRIEQGINQLVVDESPGKPQQARIDIAYMVDATGSMGDELEYLKAELAHVIGNVKKKHPGAEIHTGSVFYRDESDAYLTKNSAFTANIAETAEFIHDQSANGGGDFPEAVHTALDVTLNQLQWSEGSAKIAFLILDAPPHYNPEVVKNIHQLTAQAAAKGIKLIPIVASGIDKETEFLMRYMAIASNGTYVFITDDSGIGNAHLEASVGPFQVEHLNDVMERLISENL